MTPPSGCVGEGAEPTTPAAGRSPRRGDGGEGGIRTRDGLPQTAFPVRRHSPLGDLSPRARCSADRVRPTILGRRDGGSWQGSVRAPERTHPKVRERGAQALTHPGSSDRRASGGEGGIRTRGAFAHRFSRAAPSTTRTPLRGRGYQTVALAPPRRAIGSLSGPARSRTGRRPHRAGCRSRSGSDEAGRRAGRAG